VGERRKEKGDGMEGEREEEELATYPARGYTLPLACSYCPPLPLFVSLLCHVTPTSSFIVVVIGRCWLLSFIGHCWLLLCFVVVLDVLVVLVCFGLRFHRLCSRRSHHYCHSSCHPCCVVCGGGNDGAGEGQ